MGLKITKEQIAELPIETFDGNIYMIDHAAQIQEACSFLNSQNALGFDTETKPAFKRGQFNKVALIQLSTEKECFLFRLNKIGYPAELEAVLTNPSIMKIGLSLRDDFAAISKRTKKKPENFIDLQTFVDQYGIEDNSLQKIYAILFGKKISKNQRVSNWEAEVLTPAQRAYAAIDAWACLRIYNYLLEIQK